MYKGEGGGGAVECEREARSLGSRWDPYEIPTIALRARIQLPLPPLCMPATQAMNETMKTECWLGQAGSCKEEGNDVPKNNRGGGYTAANKQTTD